MLSFRVRVPGGLALGSHTVEVTMGDDEIVKVALFSVVDKPVAPPVDPSITIAPTSGEAGSMVTVTGADFAAGEVVGVKYGDSGYLTTGRAGDDGSVTLTITVPSDAAAGSNTVTAESLARDASDTADHMVPEPWWNRNR